MSEWASEGVRLAHPRPSLARLQVKLLVEAGALTGAHDRWKNTPGDEARRAGAAEVARFLAAAAGGR